MNLRLMLFFVAAFLSTSPSAAVEWKKVESGNLIIITDDVPRGIAAMKQIQEERHALEEMGLSFGPHSRPVTLILTHDSRLLHEAWPLNAGASATFGGLTYGYGEQAYVLVDLNKWDTDQNIAHEFVHALFSQKRSGLPLWLDEGLAENYSSLDVHDDKISFGKLDARRRWKQGSCSFLIPFEQMLASGKKSVAYGVRGGGYFYHSSAMAVRFLVDVFGIAKLDRLIQRTSEETSTQALEEIYQQTSTQIQAASEQYCRASAPSAQYAHKPLVSATVAVNSFSADEFQYLYYGLIARIAGHPQQVYARFQELLRLSPQDMKAENGVGISLAFSGKYQEASVHLLRVFQAHQADMGTLYYLLVACSNSNCPVDVVTLAQRELVRLRPDLSDVRDWRRSLNDTEHQDEDSGFLPDGGA